MADKTTAQETELTTPDGTEITRLSVSPFNTGATNRKITFANLKAWIISGLASTFSALTDAYDLSTAPVGSIPVKTGAGANLDPVVFFDSEPVTVHAVVTTSLAGYIYDNGTAGVDATLTAGSNGAFPTQDGVPTGALPNVKRYLARSFTGANRYKNGVYLLTTVGSGAAKAVLTRATDSDEPNDLVGQVVIPSGGSANARKIFSQATPATITIGTSAIVYNTTNAGNNRNLQQVTDAGYTTDNDMVTTDGTNITTLSKTGVATDNGAGITVGFNSSPGQIYVSNGTEQTVADATSISVQNLFGGTGTLMTSGGLVQGSTFTLTSISNAISILTAKVDVTDTGKLRGMFTLPVEILPAASAGYYLKPISADIWYTFNTTPYDFTTLYLKSGGATEPLMSCLNMTDGSDQASSFVPVAAPGNKTNLVENQPLFLTADADASVGEGTASLYLTFLVIQK